MSGSRGALALSSPAEISGISGAQHGLVSKQVVCAITTSGIFQFSLSHSHWVSKGQQRVFFTKNRNLNLFHA